MKIFNVYQHPTSGLEAVKIGFSWPAFFFGFIWMLIKKLWGLAGLWFLLYFALKVIETITDHAGSEPGLQAIVYFGLAGVYFALALIPGFKGNNWRINKLEKRGFEFVQEVKAETPDAAIAITAKLSNEKSIENA